MPETGRRQEAGGRRLVDGRQRFVLIRVIRGSFPYLAEGDPPNTENT